MTKVLVTGASGFIAKHIVRELLDHGYEVRGSVRAERRQAELEALFAGRKLEYATLDLTADDGWAEAVDGVDVLVHTASPFPASQPRDREKLIRPAVDGTLRAMGAAHTAGVERVILTSSCAAIYKDSSKPRMERADESHWTDCDHPDTTAYEASKTLAERAAWDFVDAHPEIRLTTINPGAVLGPAMDRHYGTSLELVEQVLDRKVPAIPDVNVPVVDVRDVARMHVSAIDTPASVGRRFAASAGAMGMLDLARTLADVHPECRIRVRRAPSTLIKLLAPAVPLVRTVRGNLDRSCDVDGSAAEDVFGFTYIPARESLLATAEFLLESR